MFTMVACGGPGGFGGAPGAGTQGRSEAAPKRITAVVFTEHPTLIQVDKALPGGEAVTAAVAAGLSVRGDKGSLVPVLAEAVPTVDNGLWKLLPDGRMETTWHLRENAVWHDGTPFTSADLVFTAQAAMDPHMIGLNENAYGLVDRMEAPDTHTLIVTWKRTFIEADELFFIDPEGAKSFPLPKHLLETAYLQDKGDPSLTPNFFGLPYWSGGFVGTGPFKVKEFVQGIHTILVANDQYVLGRPKVDELIIKYTQDLRSAVANVLAGQADMTLGRGVSFQQGVDLASQWTNGRLENVSMKSRFTLYPQFINPDPPILLNVEFRRALMHAMDRQTMADTLQLGMVPVAHAYLGPDHPMYGAIEPRIVKYEYDPRKATQMIENLGFVRGQDGRLRDASGQPLDLELRATPGDLYDKILSAVANDWKQIGIGGDTIMIPTQRQADYDYRENRPGFEMTRRSTSLSQLPRSWVFNPRTSRGAGHIARYQSAEWDALLDKYLVTVPLPERTAAVGDIIAHATTNLHMMEVMYDGEPTLISNRLVNVHGRAYETAQTWDAHLWDVR
jgi:peptide/nickel transport system substrate-binding protein